jgi:DUF1680 family protein
LLSLGNAVSVSVSTLYPFSDTLTTTITAQKAFTYYVRIPAWSIGKATVAINGARAGAANPDSTTHLLEINAAAGKTTFVLNLPADITLGKRSHCSLAFRKFTDHANQNRDLMAQ